MGVRAEYRGVLRTHRSVHTRDGQAHMRKQVMMRHPCNNNDCIVLDATWMTVCLGSHLPPGNPFGAYLVSCITLADSIWGTIAGTSNPGGGVCEKERCNGSKSSDIANLQGARPIERGQERLCSVLPMEIVYALGALASFPYVGKARRCTTRLAFGWFPSAISDENACVSNR